MELVGGESVINGANPSSLYSLVLIKRTSVAGAVLQTPLFLIHSFIESVSDPFPPNLQNIISPKP